MGVPLVSIVVPLFNCEKYIDKCLSSLLDQTLKEIEIIIVQHDSTDNSMAIAQKFADRDRRINLICRNNIKLSQARNIGLESATGTYIGFVDADDFVSPCMYEILYGQAEHCNADLAFCDYFMTYTDHEQENVIRMRDETISVEQLGISQFYIQYMASNPNVWNKIYRRDLIRQYDLHFEIENGEDLLFNMRVLPYVKIVCEISCSLYHYVQRKSSLMHESMTKYTNDSMHLLKRYLERPVDEFTDQRSGILPYYAFANMFTGFMFSPYCIKKDYFFFKKQIVIMRGSDFFESFSRKIARTTDLQELYKSKAMSIRFYWVQKLIFSLCQARLDDLAAFCMFIASKIIFLKKRKLQVNLFD